jgi:TRAP transporter TAXI family solute receptor
MQSSSLKARVIAAALAVAAVSAAACGGQAAPAGGGEAGSAKKLPSVMNWTSLDVGSATYLLHTAIAHAVSGREKATIRIIPSGSDVARNSMLAQGRVDFGVFGYVTSFEGVVFAAGGPDLGPVPLRLVAPNFPPTNTLVACAADLFGADKDKVASGAISKTPMDIPKGTRFNYIENSFGFNNANEAWIAYAGMDPQKDVTWVPVPSHGSSARTIVEGRSDCFWTATNTAQNQDLASSPRGYAPISLHKDAPKTQAAAWKRLIAVNPTQNYGVATEGVPPTSAQIPNYGNNSQFNGLETLANRDADLVYAMTKAVYSAYDDFKDAVPGIKGFKAEEAIGRVQDAQVPYHDGLIRYLKEKNLWNAEAEARNQLLLKREKALQRGWDRMLGEVAGKDLKKEDFEDKWMAIRGEELKKDGLDPYWEQVYWRTKAR